MQDGVVLSPNLQNGLYHSRAPRIFILVVRLALRSLLIYLNHVLPEHVELLQASLISFIKSRVRYIQRAFWICR